MNGVENIGQVQDFLESLVKMAQCDARKNGKSAKSSDYETKKN